ncbi:hypothetical protein MK632_14845 [Rhizobium changzhiense]|uniref:hypothetical protein n=1 Tax=Rhizobium changzhiense TaxID=2692317 RepID=UPI001F0B82CC|nr:hypothetical protein [Rhizobium changzhiense]MCH4547045.1 hypothetical protein [Rhizobium changzhiense]
MGRVDAGRHWLVIIAPSQPCRRFVVRPLEEKIGDVILFKRLAGVDLFLDLQNQKFIQRYDRYISSPPLGVVLLSVLIVLVWLLRADLLEKFTPPLRTAFNFLPKFNYELPWLGQEHPDQVILYTWLSFFLILFTVFKAALFGSYIAFSRLGREVIAKNHGEVLLKSLSIISLFFALLFLFPLPIYNTGAKSRVVGNVYILTAINIYLSTMLCGMVSATILLIKRLKTRD